MKPGALGSMLLFLLVVLGGCQREEAALPIYSSTASASSHPGFQREVLSGGGAVYVNDYEENGLRLDNPEPTVIVGMRSFGAANVCAVPGQPTSAFLAADVGSEMPAYAIFRNTEFPAFIWRTATFRKMVYGALLGPAANKQTTDSAAIADVVELLKDGPHLNPPGFDPRDYKKFTELYLYSDQLAGMKFDINLYTDAAGEMYLGETRNAGQWIKASPTTAHWLETP